MPYQRIQSVKPEVMTYDSFVVQEALIDVSVQNIYAQRNTAHAPALSSQFDGRGQAIYSGLDPKTVFRAPTPKNGYRHIPDSELKAAANALNQHGERSVEVARKIFGLTNVVWLGLANKTNHLVIDSNQHFSRPTETKVDDLGTFTRSPQTDIALVSGRKRSEKGSITLAMGVSDCLAVPIMDVRTEAMAFVHSGRPGTALRVAEKTVRLLKEEFGSRPRDLIAHLGEGVCSACYHIDETTYNKFSRAFGGRAAINKVLEQYPGAIKQVAGVDAPQYSVDLYAFNKYLLSEQEVSEIIEAPNCTARSSENCISVGEEGVPAEHDQPFYSHSRAKNKKVGWRMANGAVAELDTAHLSTPRNLTFITRF